MSDEIEYTYVKGKGWIPSTATQGHGSGPWYIAFLWNLPGWRNTRYPGASYSEYEYAYRQYERYLRNFPHYQFRIQTDYI